MPCCVWVTCFLGHTTMIGGNVAGQGVTRFMSPPPCYLVSISFWHHCTVTRMPERRLLLPGYPVVQTNGSSTATRGGSRIYGLQSCCCPSYPPPIVASRILPGNSTPATSTGAASSSVESFGTGAACTIPVLPPSCLPVHSNTPTFRYTDVWIPQVPG